MAWVNGAVDSTSIYVPRKSLMYQFDLATETWTTRKETIPNGNVQTGAAVFDGSGKIWYEGSATCFVSNWYTTRVMSRSRKPLPRCMAPW